MSVSPDWAHGAWRPLPVIDFRQAGLWGWIIVNIAVAITLSLLFLKYHEWWILLLIILNAGWQKYMNGRIPPRLQETFQSVKL